MRFAVIGMFCLLQLTIVDLSAQSVPEANTILREAMQVAEKSNKNVLVIFTASWCGWCHKMRDNINDSSIKQFFEDHYIIQYLTVQETQQNKKLETPGADLLLVKHNANKSGIPFWLVFNPKGVLLADSKYRKPGEGPAEGANVGCPATEEEVNYFIEVLQNTSTLSTDELQMIRAVFSHDKNS